MRIKGVGKHTADKYGEQLIAIVCDYCHKHNVEPQQTPPESTSAQKESKKRIKKDTKQISYELYLQGKSITEIAQERGLVTTTVEGHLAHYVGMGQLDIAELMDEEKITMIKQAFDEKGMENLKDIKEHLGEEYSYGEIRLVFESVRG